MMPVVEFSLFVPGTVFTLNGERKLTPHERAARVKLWRHAAWGVVNQHRPHHRGLTDVRIVATPFLGSARSQDVGGCFPVVKAAIDGLVDARVMDDDGPTIVKELAFRASERAPSRGGEGLRLDIRGVSV
jgi:hypothetical protein